MDTLCCTCCDRHAQKHLSKLSLFAAQRVERVNALRNSLKIHIDGSDVPEPIADLATLAARRYSCSARCTMACTSAQRRMRLCSGRRECAGAALSTKGTSPAQAWERSDPEQ